MTISIITLIFARQCYGCQIDECVSCMGEVVCTYRVQLDNLKENENLEDIGLDVG
jgi:hypothetical protein